MPGSQSQFPCHHVPASQPIALLVERLVRGFHGGRGRFARLTRVAVQAARAEGAL